MTAIEDIIPDETAQAQIRDLSKAIFQAITCWFNQHQGEHGMQPNGLYVNDALAMNWAAFCGQLPNAKRDGMILRFCHQALDETLSDGFTRQPEPGDKAN